MSWQNSYLVFILLGSGLTIQLGFLTHCLSRTRPYTANREKQCVAYAVLNICCTRAAPTYVYTSGNLENWSLVPSHPYAKVAPERYFKGAPKILMSTKVVIFLVKVVPLLQRTFRAEFFSVLRWALHQYLCWLLVGVRLGLFYLIIIMSSTCPGPSYILLSVSGVLYGALVLMDIVYVIWNSRQ